ncbi:hypothetical protein BBJ28_00003623 [Nothophytophthora sp. Chile5]|nr:hypothetical protein BBJ28_00003623 [Nothophytophthora sp. Chile5]
MVGLSAAQLPPDTLHDGGSIVYYSLGFVFGDHRGYREAVVTKVDATPGKAHPIAITTGELIQLTQMVMRTHDSDRNSVNGTWRKLRTFALVSGEFDAQTDRSLFCEMVNSIITAVFSGHVNLGRAIRDQIPVTTRESVTQRRATPSHASVAAAVEMTRGAGAENDLEDGDECEEKALVPISNGSTIYHAHTVKAKQMEDLLRLPGMRNKLSAVRGYIPTFVEPTPPPPYKVTQVNVYQTYVMEEMPWPDWVKPITQSIVPAGLRFEDIGDGDACLCHGDCFADTCTNAKMAIYCTPDCCRLNAKCSNAPRTHPGLKVYDTYRLGLGVYTTEALFAGEIIAEYSGSLCEYKTLYEGQPEEAKKQNSGYTMLLNEKSKRGRFVYVEALKCGSIARFFQHACTPNVEFVEMQNRSSVKVLARMIESVAAGAQIVVHYGDEIWFKCSCDICWNEHGSN